MQKAKYASWQHSQPSQAVATEFCLAQTALVLHAGFAEQYVHPSLYWATTKHHLQVTTSQLKPCWLPNYVAQQTKHNTSTPTSTYARDRHCVKQCVHPNSTSQTTGSCSMPHCLTGKARGDFKIRNLQCRLRHAQSRARSARTLYNPRRYQCGGNKAQGCQDTR